MLNALLVFSRIVSDTEMCFAPPHRAIACCALHNFTRNNNGAEQWLEQVDSNIDRMETKRRYSSLKIN
jgi:hypothetical protein